MTLSALLLEYALPLTVGFIGWLVSMRGAASDYTVFFGLMLMATMPAYAVWGAKKEERVAAEIREEERFEAKLAASREANAPKLMMYSETVGHKTLIYGLPLEPKKLKMVAA